MIFIDCTTTADKMQFPGFRCQQTGKKVERCPVLWYDDAKSDRLFLNEYAPLWDFQGRIHKSPFVFT